MDPEERAHDESLLLIYTRHLRQWRLWRRNTATWPSHRMSQWRSGNIAGLEARLHAPVMPQPSGPRHNLPPRDYERFVGRQPELAELRRLLGPHSRAFVMTIDGIGRIGKSALALEGSISPGGGAQH
jgi:hypothetical protein